MRVIAFSISIFVLLSSSHSGFAQTKQVSKSYFVQNLAAISISIETVQPETCYFAGGDGSIDVDVTGNFGPFVYEWKNGAGTVIATTEDIFNLVQGNYTLKVTDTNSCTATRTINVYYYCPYSCGPSVTTSNENKPSSCTDVSGSFDYSIVGSTTVYQYQLTKIENNGFTRTLVSSGTISPMGSFASLGSGIYEFIVYNDGSTTCLTSVEINLNALNFYIYEINTSSNSSCSSPDGTLNVVVVGGSGNFSYDVATYDGASLQNIATSTSSSFGGLISESYYVTVTDIVTGCKIYGSTYVGSTTSGLLISANITDQTSCSSPNGAIDIEISGGTGSYNIYWNGPNGFFSSSDDVSNTIAGSYYINVADNISKCSANFSYLIGDLTPTPTMSLGAITDNTNCTSPFNGSADITVNGGNGPFTFIWNDANDSYFSDLEDPADLGPGQYSVKITSNDGCILEVSPYDSNAPSILDLSSPSVDFTQNSLVNNTACSTPFNGIIDLSISAGGNSFTTQWYGPSGFVAGNVQQISALQAGQYTVTVEVQCNASGNPPIISYSTLTATTCTPSVDLAPFLSDPDGNINLASLQVSIQPPSGAVASISGTILTVNYSGITVATDETLELKVCDLATACTTKVITIITNKKPILTLGSSSFIYPGTGSLTLATSPAVIDDNNSISGATVAFTSNYKSAEDRLDMAAAGGITASFNTGTGILTLTGTATPSAYQAAINSIRYSNIQALPDPAIRTIQFNLTDGCSVSAQAPITVSINSAPVLSPVSVGKFYLSGQQAVMDGINVADANDVNLIGGTIAISSGYKSEKDLLLFTNQNGITGNFNTGTGALTLAGNASVANYQLALRSVKYQLSDPTSLGARTIIFSVRDNFVSSAIASAAITINSPPVIVSAEVTAVLRGFVELPLNSLLQDVDANLDPTSLKIKQQPISGAIASIDLVSLSLKVDYSKTDFAGRDELKIEVCDVGNLCSTQSITIDVKGDIVVFNGISPNGDGLNQYFIIQNIEVIDPTNKVSIFNRWGDKVFEVNNYNNTNRRFEGISSSGNELPNGVYFYKIDFASGRSTLTGFVTIKR